MPFWPADWTKVFVPNAPIVESIVRVSVVYLFFFVVLRVVLKRESGGTAISDLLVLVMLADAVQNGMAGDYTSIGNALVLGSTLIFWDWLVSWMAYHVPAFSRLVRPKPLLIIKDGRLLTGNARHELLTRADIEAQLRLQGIESIAACAEARVESNGEISARKKEGETQHEKPRRPLA